MTKDKLHFLSPLFLKYQAEFEKNPRSRVFAPLAESYRKVGMFDKALEILSQGIRYNPNYVMGYLGLAYCYSDMKQFNLAYTTLRPLVETNRDNLRLQKLFADVCLETLRSEEALETLKFLLFLNPKDREVANQVTKLEKELEEKFKMVHNPIIIPEEELTDVQNSGTFFDVNKLDSTPKIDFDDWLHVDLNPKDRSLKSQNNLNEWSVSKLSQINNEEVFQYDNDLNIKKDIIQENQIDIAHEAPIVTHTLVDLYCGQGHIEKALEILEKILILNPSDQKTRDKINEIKNLMLPDEDIEEIVFDQKENDELEEIFDIKNIIGQSSSSVSHQEKLIDIDQLENISEEDGRRNLMSILDEKILSNIETNSELNLNETQNYSEINKRKERLSQIEAKLGLFLKLIKERALDYQARF